MPAGQVRTQHSAVNGAVLASDLPEYRHDPCDNEYMHSTSGIVIVVQPPLPLGTAGAHNWQLCHAASANTLVTSKLRATHLLQ